jgi:ribosomal protein S18 acetylase RimI-like enzyme
MSNLIYRQAGPSDIPGMARLRALKRGTAEYWTDLISRYFDGEHNPQHALASRVGYVAREGETVVGFIAGQLTRRYACDGELQWIFVDPESREHGVASELLRLLANWFVEQNAFKVCVDVDPSNTAAHRFYKKRGAVDLNSHWLVWNDIRTVVEQSGTNATS